MIDDSYMDGERDLLSEVIDAVRSAGLAPPVLGFHLRGDGAGGEYAVLTHVHDLEVGTEDRIRDLLRPIPIRYQLTHVGPKDGWMWHDDEGRAWFGQDGQSIRNPDLDQTPNPIGPV